MPITTQGRLPKKRKPLKTFSYPSANSGRSAINSLAPRLKKYAFPTVTRRHKSQRNFSIPPHFKFLSASQGMVRDLLEADGAGTMSGNTFGRRIALLHRQIVRAVSAQISGRSRGSGPCGCGGCRGCSTDRQTARRWAHAGAARWRDNARYADQLLGLE